MEYNVMLAIKLVGADREWDEVAEALAKRVAAIPHVPVRGAKLHVLRAEIDTATDPEED